MPNKYIFVAGAPGSKWSSVVKNIYYSPDVDRSDYSDERTYYHSAWGQPELMHLGAYFDPGMEFGKKFMRLPQIDPVEAEVEFNRPFSSPGKGGIKIIKSHVFCHHLDYIRETWPDCPIVLVHRPNDACIGWWVRCGQFNITYPNYQFYSNLDMMSMHIDQQNRDLKDFAFRNGIGFSVKDNHHLCNLLGIDLPPEQYKQDYSWSDIKVAVIK